MTQDTRSQQQKHQHHQEEELLEIDLPAYSPSKPLGIEFLFGHLDLPRGPTRGLFVRRIDKRLSNVDGRDPDAVGVSLLEEGDFVLSANGRDLRAAASEAAAMEAVRQSAGPRCRLRILRSDFVRSEFLNCLVRSLNGDRALPAAVVDSVDAAKANAARQQRRQLQSKSQPRLTQQPQISTLSSGARVPLAKLESALARLGYRFSPAELAQLRAAVAAGSGDDGVPFGRFIAAVSDICGRRRVDTRPSNNEVDDAVIVGASATSLAAPPPSSRHRPNAEKVSLTTSKQLTRTSTTATQTLPHRSADADQSSAAVAAAAAAVAEAKSEARDLADRCAALQRRLDESETTGERDRRRLAVLAGELRKAGRHNNRLATALQATLDLLGRLNNLDDAERAEADAVAEQVATLLGSEDATGEREDDLPTGWESARIGNNPETVVYVNHAEGRVAAARQAPAPRLDGEAVGAGEGERPKRLQRYRMDVLDRNGVPVRQIAL